MKKITTVAMLFASFIIANKNFAQSGYHITDSFHIQSSGGWDYIAADANSNRLYVSHSTQVNILDKNTGDSLGVIPNTTGVHGIAFVHSLGKGYTSNGRINTVTVFDLKTANIITQISTGQNPDAIFYDDYSKKIITCNGRSKSLSIIDPSTDSVVATIPLSGKPETAVSDGKGKVFVNIEDKSEISVVDITKNIVINSWSIAPGDSPSGLSIDRNTNRLFAGCDNKLMMIIDAANGKVVTQLPIGDGCDGTGFDASLKYAYASCGDGTLTVVKEVSKDEFKVLESIATKKGARTMTVDAQTHNIYLPTADFLPSTNENERPKMIPGTFLVLMLQKK